VQTGEWTSFAYLGAGRAETLRGVEDKTERRNEERLIIRDESDSLKFGQEEKSISLEPVQKNKKKDIAHLRVPFGASFSFHALIQYCEMSASDEQIFSARTW
jgi:hypothetical protein